jgi:hypothetical protein
MKEIVDPEEAVCLMGSQDYEGLDMILSGKTNFEDEEAKEEQPLKIG